MKNARHDQDELLRIAAAAGYAAVSAAGVDDAAQPSRREQYVDAVRRALRVILRRFA